jgi:DTW domain-containing protein YfiP
MFQRIPELRALPRVSLPGRPAERLREPTVKEGMSTIEALAEGLDLLGDGAAAEALRRTWSLAVLRGLALRRAPGRFAAPGRKGSAP